jgi:hypothetical protein
MNTAHSFPPPAQILERIRACRQEIAALKQILRAAQAAERAEEARRRREAREQEAAHVG